MTYKNIRIKLDKDSDSALTPQVERRLLCRPFR